MKATPIIAASLISLVVLINPPAGAESISQSRRDGNYRFCSRPPQSKIASDQDMLHAGYCFVFRKSGPQVVGFFGIVPGDTLICVSGSIDKNTVKGKALQPFLPGNPPPQEMIDAVNRGSSWKNWDGSGFLKVARGSVTNSYTSNQKYHETVIQYNQAQLNLESFYRYNAGVSPPPKSCNEI